VIVPFAAGVASALGLLIAEPRFDVARTLVVALDGAPWERIDQLFDAMEAEGKAQLEATGLGGAWRMSRAAEVRYAGQGHELGVPIPSGRLGPETLAAIGVAHAGIYAAHYGYAEPVGTPLEASNWKLEIAGTVPPVVLSRPVAGGGDARKGARPVYFPEAGGFVDCPVYDRYRLGPGMAVRGPAVIEERETTAVLLPGDTASVDEHGNLIIHVAAE
jgi:N-methylhydantoinase A